jgi:hypothetical protein
LANCILHLHSSVRTQFLGSTESEMESRKAQSIDEFCDEQRFSRSHYYNLKRIGRGPVETRSGGVVTITPENAAAWRKDIEANPIVGGARRLVAEARAASESKAA